jgi:hypothetical protein
VDHHSIEGLWLCFYGYSQSSYYIGIVLMCSPMEIEGCRDFTILALTSMQEQSNIEELTVLS